MKGIILAGGSGTRLFPTTLSVCKQLLPVYDKPMIYYPLSTLMLANIRDILIISTHIDTPRFQQLLGDGHQWGINLSYAVQPEPEGIAQAFLIGKEFIGNDDCSLILGDNIFFGHELSTRLAKISASFIKSTIFAYRVNDPERYGVVTFDNDGEPLSLVEKPQNPVSKYAVTGLYFYDQDVVEISESLKPSKRGELEITDVNRVYLENKKLNVEILGRGMAWLDTGTHESLLDASHFVRTIEKRQGLKVACLEEIAWQKEWISDELVRKTAMNYGNSDYGKYLSGLLEGDGFAG